MKRITTENTEVTEYNKPCATSSFIEGTNFPSIIEMNFFRALRVLRVESVLKDARERRKTMVRLCFLCVLRAPVVNAIF
jgi:hypothetical protein